MPPRRAPGHSGGMQQTAKSATPVRVFVVEDSMLIRERLEAMLAQAGAASAGHAARVADAIQGILLERPDLVLLDLQLADGTGFEVLRVLRRRAPEIDVYLLSNHSSYPYRQLAERLGARGFFDKSSEFSRMRDVVRARATAQ
jgi:DNA-binding NarL/FixJ family response regulator